MKAFLIFVAKTTAAMIGVVLVLALAQQWDEADTARVRVEMQRKT
ncbi:hypothetical protein [Burkholderia cepacia]|nr:hypothetical protein [Burkholderia cepacia]